MTNSPKIITLGCRLNAYESEVMRAHAGKAGLDDAVIINTCTVTREAERQARREVRKARAANPSAKIIVTGCAAQVSPEQFAAMDEVDVVLGNDEKMQAGSYDAMAQDFGAGREEKIRVNDIMAVEETASHMVSSFEGQTRAFVQVQNGCNHRCTFCVIPFGRGNSRSVPVGEVVREIQVLVAQGYKEVVLTGVDISSYGENLPGTPLLGSLVRRILNLVPELPRLRLSSIDAVEVDDELFQAIAEEERLMPHLHISIQAGDDMVLKRMKRRHLRQDILDFCEKVRAVRPDMVFGADIIAGFPTETDEMFQRTLDLVPEAGLTYLHVFPYSEREGTPAAKMPLVPMALRKERARLLREAGEKELARFLASKVGATETVLMEKGNIGRTAQFAPVKMDSDFTAGELVEATIICADDAALYGRVAK